jgi:transketolase
MPSWEVFAARDQSYRDEVLPPDVKARVAVESGSPMGWERWVGDSGAIIAIDRFGASAPGGEIFKNWGFTPENVAELAKKTIAAVK